MEQGLMPEPQNGEVVCNDYKLNTAKTNGVWLSVNGVELHIFTDGHNVCVDAYGADKDRLLDEMVVSMAEVKT